MVDNGNTTTFAELPGQRGMPPDFAASWILQGDEHPLLATHLEKPDSEVNTTLATDVDITPLLSGGSRLGPAATGGAKMHAPDFSNHDPLDQEGLHPPVQNIEMGSGLQFKRDGTL